MPLIRYAYLPVILVLAATLCTSNCFYYASSAGFYAYTITTGALSFMLGGRLMLYKKIGFQPFNIPLGLFFAYTVYVLLNTTIKGGLNYISVWALVNFLFFFSTLLLLFSLPNKSAIFQLLNGLVILAALESMVCIAQYFHGIASNNHFFSVTGTLENPNVTAMFLALCLPAILTCSLQPPRLYKIIGLTTLAMLLIALFLLRCRSALAGAVCMTLVYCQLRLKILSWLISGRYRTAAILTTAATLLLSTTLVRYSYLNKKASADGRQLIWRLSFRMIPGHALTGVGYGHFEQQFNLFQAGYIRNGKVNRQEERNAGIVYVAYNEFLQNTVEGGIPGGLLYLGLTISLLVAPLRYVRTAAANSFPGLIPAYSGMAGFALMSLVNFTSPAPPLTAMFAIYAAILTGYSPAFTFLPRPHRATKYALAGFLLIAGAGTSFTQGNIALADNRNRLARTWTAAHRSDIALSLLPSLAGPLAGYESYWKNYGYTLVAAKQYSTALPILEKAETLVTESSLFMAAGYCHLQLKNYPQAILQYQEAVYLEPTRLGPRHALAAAYRLAGDTAASSQTTREIIALEPKIPSDQATYYKDAAASLLKSLYESRKADSLIYPENVRNVLIKAGNNKTELEKAIQHYKHVGDPRKLKAAYFLIGNMDIHYTADYYWQDMDGKKVAYDELAYPDLATAIRAFGAIKEKTPNIRPHPTLSNDAQTITADYLIRDIDAAFEEWEHSSYRSIDFADFCEYILPYRISVEPVQDWRTTYHYQFSWAGRKIDSLGMLSAISNVATANKTWFTNTYSQENRNEPLPRLGSMQLLFRKRGPCEDIADLEVFMLRSQGIPATAIIIPFWATSTGGHFFNTAFDTKMHPVSFDASRSQDPLMAPLSREPAKVLMLTYSRQPTTLAYSEDPKNIPEGFLLMENYIDVTNRYWKTADVHCALFPAYTHARLIYAAVFNGMKWCAAWWSHPQNGAATFGNMCKGAVFLPTYYSNGHLAAAGYPVAVGYHHTRVLIPDTVHRKTIAIPQDGKHLLLRIGQKYRLLYWDDRWIKLGLATAASGETALSFSDVPRNALLFLLPEYSEGKERPFIIADNGATIWF